MLIIKHVNCIKGRIFCKPRPADGRKLNPWKKKKLQQRGRETDFFNAPFSPLIYLCDLLSFYFLLKHWMYPPPTHTHTAAIKSAIWPEIS